jgi:hypothetical protein
MVSKDRARKQPLRTLAAVALLMVTWGSTTAWAFDQKNYGGATCHPATASDSARVRYNQGTVSNTSTTTALLLDCPIIRDETKFSMSSGLVAVVDPRIDEQVSCTMRSLRAVEGAQLTLVDFRTEVSGVPDGRVTIKHLLFPSLAKPPGDFGYYTMNCRIPPASTAGVSKILFYSVRENN